jgi:Uma2 family endonuclease
MAIGEDILVPPLQPNDRLTREEFLRRWELHPEIKFAELIGGVVRMPSPIKMEHGDRESDLGLWLSYYQAKTPGTRSSHNITTLMLEDCPQPDLHLRIVTASGGQSDDSGPYLAGAPELVVEICASSAVYDLQEKLELYQEAGVREYVAVVLGDRVLRWHQLVSGKYELMQRPADGVWRSGLFPGLWLDEAAFWVDDHARMLATVDEGLQTPEHGEFVRQLAARRGA